MSVYLLLDENAACASLNKKSFIWDTHSEVFLPLKIVLEENALSFRRIFFFISCIFYWFRCNDGYMFSVSFFLFLNIALVMKITIKIPFYERFHLMLFVYRENRGNDGYHAQTNKRGETWAGCLQIMMIILQNDLSKIFSWPEGGWITRPNYPPSTWTIFLQVNIHNLTLLTSNV